MFKYNKLIINGIIILFFVFCLSPKVFAFDVNQNVYINQSYSFNSDSSIKVVLLKSTNQALFYTDSTWWSKLSSSEQSNIQNKIYDLSTELEYRIKPILNSNYGFEADPINSLDKRLIIILTPMIEGIQGYIKTSDFVLKVKNQSSNEGNIIYLNGDKVKTVETNILNSFLAHEFTHLISYNQKYLKQNLVEDLWLEEARAEYAPTLLGYNSNWDNSYLKIRATDFFQNNSISFMDWSNTMSNYSSINLFATYLAEQYGKEILVNSIHSNKIGIDSLNEALKSRGVAEDFNQIYQNWLIANILNNCSVSLRYCYQNINLKNLAILPANFYLPVNNNSALAISDTLVPYMAKYQKISGGDVNLNFDFENTPDNLTQKIPYLLVNKNGDKQLYFFEFQKNKSQKIVIPDFNKEITTLIFIPYLIRNDDNYGIRSIFKWSVQTGQGTTVPSTGTTVAIPSTKPATSSESTTAMILRQQQIIALQTKLIALLLELISSLKLRLGI